MRVNALGEHVDAQRHQVDVSGAFTVAEQASFDAVGASQVAKFGRGNRGPAVVVWVQRQQHAVSASEPAVHPFDGVGVDVRGGHLNRGGQVDDHLVIGRGLQLIDDGVADFQGVFQLGAGVAFRRVLVVHVRARNGFLHFAALACAVQGDVEDALLVSAEHHGTLQYGRGVVEVHDGALGPGDRFVGALDEVVTRLGEYLDGHVVGDGPLFDEAANEVEVGLARAGEPHLDFLIAHLDQQIEHDPLALGTHRIDERLVAVAQVNRAPARRFGDVLVRPRPVRQLHVDLVAEWLVAVHRHGAGLLGVLHDCSFLTCASARERSGRDGTPRREEPGIRPRRGSEEGASHTTPLQASTRESFSRGRYDWAPR